MYIYIDEIGNFGWPIKASSEQYMLFSLLVIHDQKSKHAIAQAKTDCDEMKRALSREVSDYMHRQFHRENTS